MDDLDFLQLLIICTAIFLIFIHYKKKSKFAAGPPLDIPWNLYAEKNKIYVIVKDPLNYDLGYTYRTVNTAPLLKYQAGQGYATKQFVTGITIEEDDRLDLLTSVDTFVKFQNSVVDDLNILATTMGIFNSMRLKFDFSAITKLDITDIPKYKMLQTGLPRANLLICEDFENIVLPDGVTVIEPKNAWDVSDTVIGVNNVSISGDTLFYQSTGNSQSNVPDESSVKFLGGIGILGSSSLSAYPPSMYDPTIPSSKAAVFTYINLNNNTNITSPYLRQNVYLKKGYTYTLNFFYYGFLPLLINVIKPSDNWKKTLVGTQTDIGFNTWFYRQIDFDISSDGVYIIEFTPLLTGSSAYLGTDPEGKSHKYNGKCMLQKVFLEVNVPKSKIPGYSELIISNNLKEEKVTFVLLNGKLLRLNMNTYNSSDPSIINKRRDDTSKFITKNYVV